MEMKRAHGAWRIVCALSIVSVSLLAGCSKQRVLARAPYECQGVGAAMFDSVPAPLCTTSAQVMYVTDRAVSKETPAGPEFDYHRERTLTYGLATIDFKGPRDWSALKTASTSETRPAPIVLSITKVEPRGKLVSMLDQIGNVGDRIDVTPEGKAMEEQDVKQFHDLLRERLALSPQKDVYIWVHGYSNPFNSAVNEAAELWHYLGRRGVAIAYTWPAGSPNPLRGYLQDRESGEFTNTHLKQFIRAVASCPEVERVHIVSHSRGTDIAFTAVRELHIEMKNQGKDTQKALKLETLIFAAPDIDGMVFGQRFFGDNMTAVARRTIVYFSSSDSAIGLSQMLFRGGIGRLGQFRAEDIPERGRAILDKYGRVELVACKLTAKQLSSHWYLFDHPAGLSDLILVLRDRRDAGAEYGRPLKVALPGVWLLDNDYRRNLVAAQQ